MSVLSLQKLTATPKAIIKTIVLSTAVVTTVAMTGCASKPQVQMAKRYAKAPNFYTVMSGDTLSGIAARYGLNYVTIAEMNDIAAPYRIYVGQSIRLKETGQRTVSTDSITQTAPIQRQTIAVPALTTTAPVAAPTTTVTTPTVKAPTTTVKPSTASTTVKPVTVTPNLTNNSRLQWTKPSSNAILQRFNATSDVKGTRYAGKNGDPVYAAAAGQVVYAADGLKEYGNLVLIKHIDGYISAYAHNSKMLVKSGQNVTAGQKIAEMGATGTDRTMLDFQIRLNGKPIDPATVLSNN